MHLFSNYSRFTLRTNDGNLGGVRPITQRALNGMSGMRQVSIQEAVHMVDNQKLVICSETITHLSLAQGAMLKSEKDANSTDILVRMYRNRSETHKNMSLDSYFYKFFVEKRLRLERRNPREQKIECYFQRV